LSRADTSTGGSGPAAPIVTLDGPAGSGKSTTARAVADRLGFRHLDSGSLYRALTLALLRAGVPAERWGALTEADFGALDVAVDPTTPEFGVLVGGRPVKAELRTREVTEAVSHLAQLPAARACLLELQREAGALGGLVADGRDMGTVVFPEAEVKVYLVADLAERARRRLAEAGRERPSDDDVRHEAEAIDRRDRRDSERDVSPLRVPDGAHRIDTTGMSFEDQVQRIVDLVRPLTGP